MYDSLLAKLICHSPSGGFSDAIQRTYCALCEFNIGGVATNASFLQNILCHPAFRAADLHTVRVDTIGNFKPCMTEIYLHI